MTIAIKKVTMQKHNNIDIKTIKSTDYKNLTASISIKSPEKDKIILQRPEKYYEERLMQATCQKDIECYERARLICKWAETCSAKIKSQQVERGRLNFVFSFSSRANLDEFNDGLDEAIAQAKGVNYDDISKRSGR